MSRRGELDAIVVGAGAVGASLALGLARDGLEVALVEAREPAAWHADAEVDLRVAALAPDARALLADLDVWTSIQSERSCAFRYMRVWDARSAGELHFDAADNGDAALGWIVENALIQHVLWQAIAANVQIRLLCPNQLVAIENDVEGVSATLDDGRRLRARLLVGAEGAASGVREKLGIAFIGRDYHQRAIVAHVATERPHQHTAWQRFQPGGPLAFLPLADGRCSVVWSLPDADAARMLALDDEAFRKALGCAFDFRLGTTTSTTKRASFPLRMRLANRYVEGRCVLAGDAAHVVHPLAGQGMNLGLRDVACLRRVLRDARERGSDAGAAHVLRRYERERRSDNAVNARGLDSIERAFGVEVLSLAGLRGLAMSTVSRSAMVRSAAMRIAAGR